MTATRRHDRQGHAPSMAAPGWNGFEQVLDRPSIRARAGSASPLKDGDRVVPATHGPAVDIGDRVVDDQRGDHADPRRGPSPARSGWRVRVTRRGREPGGVDPEMGRASRRSARDLPCRRRAVVTTRPGQGRGPQQSAEGRGPAPVGPVRHREGGRDERAEKSPVDGEGASQQCPRQEPEHHSPKQAHWLSPGHACPWSLARTAWSLALPTLRPNGQRRCGLRLPAMFVSWPDGRVAWEVPYGMQRREATPTGGPSWVRSHRRH